MKSKVSEKPKAYHKKGLWSPDEDQKLTHYLMNHGHSCWTSVGVNAGLQRNGKSCRLRWINYLRPGLKRGAFSLQEEEIILTLHQLLGNRWSQISQHLPGRTDNEIKNYWHSHLKKRLAKSKHLQAHHKLDHTSSIIASKDSSSSCLNTSNLTKGWFSDMDESVPPVSNINTLPKLLFAEWATLNEFQQDFCKSRDQPPLSHGSDYDATHVQGWLSNEGSTNYNQNSQHCLINNSSNEDLFHTEVTIDQIFSFNGGDFNMDDFVCM